MAKAVQIKQSSFFSKNPWLFAVLTVVFVVFSNTLVNDYNMDDEIVTNHHPLTSQGISAIPKILKSPYFQADIYSYEYRPVVHISFAIEHQFLGESAGVSHFINLLLYMILVLVAFNLIKQLFPTINEMLLAFITLLFALHPTHTEVVASIKNRDEILALLFTLLAFKDAIKLCSSVQWWRIFTVLIYFNIALGSKVTVLPFAFVIPFSIQLLLNPKHTFYPLLLSLLLSIFSTLWIETFSFEMQFKFVLGNLLLMSFIYWQEIKWLIQNIYNLLESSAVSLAVEEKESSQFFIHSFSSAFSVLKAYKWWVLLLIVLNGLVFVLGAVGWTWLVLMGLVTIAFYFSKSEELGKFLLLIFILISYEIAWIYYGEGTITFILIGIIYMGLAWQQKLIHPIFILIYIIPDILSLELKSLWILLGFNTISIDSSKKYIQRGGYFLYSILLIMMVRKAVLYEELIFIVLILGICLTLTAIILYKQIIRKISSKNFLTLFLVSVTILFLLKFIDNPIENNFRINSIVPTAQTLNSVTPQKIVPTASYRPVLFAEYPITDYPTPFEEKLGLSAVALLKYLKLSVLPYPLAYYYGYKEIEPLPINSFPVILSIALHLLLLFSMFYFYWKKKNLIAFGIAFYLITISPFSTFLYPIPGVVADRYLFAPTLGLSFFIVGILCLIFKVDFTSNSLKFSTLNRNMKYIVLGILVSYSFISFARNFDWKDKLTLFENDIHHVENSAQAQNLLAFHLSAEAQKVPNLTERTAMLEEAAFHFRRAVEIWPDFLNAFYDLGRTNEQLGHWNEAINAYKRTFAIDTTFSDAIFRAGIVYDGMGKTDSAIICYEYVTKKNPNNTTAFNNLSFIYFKNKDFKKSLEVCKTAYSVNPNNTDALLNIGKIFINTNEKDSAIYYFDQAYSARGNDVELMKILYQLHNEKDPNSPKTQFYFNELRRFGVIR